jgi:hypothetical protein
MIARISLDLPDKNGELARAQNNLRRVETLWMNFELVEQMRLESKAGQEAGASALMPAT